MKIVAISDTHCQHQQITVPDGDILIHAGDFTNARLPSTQDTITFNKWLGELPHPHKIVIAGNHDTLFEKHPSVARSLMTNATYLENELIDIEGVLIYGTPYTPSFQDWAFNLDLDELAENARLIPRNTNILISHGPAYGKGDMVTGSQRVGCRLLAARLQKLKSLKAHIFGHIHEGYGQYGTSYNVSICNTHGRPVNAPTVIEI